MAKLADITSFLSDTLQCEQFEDASLNGLQIEGNESVTKIAVAVDAGLSVVQQAISSGAQFLFVHHGLFWGKPFAITGAKKRLFRTMLEADLSLYGVHLPLDANPTYGNNFTLARLLGLDSLEAACAYHGTKIGCKGKNSKNLSLQELKKRLTSLPGTKKDFVTLEFGPAVPDSVAVVSGGGVDALYEFESEGFDTLITGEIRHWSYHFAKENNLNVVFAGHYATETVGVRELAAVLKEKFGVEIVFIDQPTGM